MNVVSRQAGPDLGHGCRTECGAYSCPPRPAMQARPGVEWSAVFSWPPALPDWEGTHDPVDITRQESGSRGPSRPGRLPARAPDRHRRSFDPGRPVAHHGAGLPVTRGPRRRHARHVDIIVATVRADSRGREARRVRVVRARRQSGHLDSNCSAGTISAQDWCSSTTASSRHGAVGASTPAGPRTAIRSGSGRRRGTAFGHAACGLDVNEDVSHPGQLRADTGLHVVCDAM
jgi:hypothetical protein